MWTKWTLGYILISILIYGCTVSRPTISAHTDFLSAESLASYHVGTPDPALHNPPVGQRLLITWSIPRFIHNDCLWLDITIRFHDDSEKKLEIPIHERCGRYIYSLVNEDYFAHRGILTYKIILRDTNTVFAQWLHQLWAERICFE